MEKNRRPPRSGLPSPEADVNEWQDYLRATHRKVPGWPIGIDIGRFRLLSPLSQQAPKILRLLVDGGLTEPFDIRLFLNCLLTSLCSQRVDS